MTSEPDWVPPGVDTKRANVARVYDYLLGGTHNFLADQDVGRAAIAVEPAAREHMRANRAFLGRAIRYLAASGGSGDPPGLVTRLLDPMAPGSYVVVSHITDDRKPQTAAALEKVYNRNIPQTGYFRSGADIRKLLGNLDLVDPGLVTAPYWRPDPPGPPENADKIWGVLGAVARKP